MITNDLLIEIGTEELPPKALIQLATAFAKELEDGLLKANLAQQNIQWFATPRRLAVIVSDLETQQADNEVIRRGPALAAAFDDKNKPTPAAIGFAKSCGVEVNDLETLQTDKGEWLSYRMQEKGKQTIELIPELTNQALSRLPIPKRMRWGSGDIEFARPVHWAVVLFGDDLIECEILNVKSTRSTYGHRFHHPQAISLDNASEYEDKLNDPGKVIADFVQRREAIKSKINAAAAEINGTALIDDNLLNEVTALVEWPVALPGKFDNKFLKLPKEVLIASMQDHQKYFPILDNNENLLASFITIANIESNKPEVIRSGNERVIRPRLSDAEFFWLRDTKIPLADYLPGLSDVIFQQKLGTLADRTGRISKIAEYIANELDIDKTQAQRAATLCKCDLLTDMVGEFPELQGVMGRYYALQAKEAAEVAKALDEQYMPRFAGDQLPATKTGQILSIADKLELLTGIFATGQPPTGDKDPFGLRRAALGCLRIMIECGLKQLDLKACLEFAAGTFDKNIKAGRVTNAIFDFMMERLRGYYADRKIRPDVFAAVHAARPMPTHPYDFDRRIQAVTEFTRLPEADSLAAANKRIQNILRQAGDGDPDSITPAIDGSLSVEDAEKNLFEQQGSIVMKVQPLTANKNYKEALNELSRLRDPVDLFFDNVMVMVDDDKLRNSRLQLLASIRHEFQKIADVSQLQG